MEPSNNQQGHLMTGVNPYVQNIAENTIDDLSGKSNTRYDQQQNIQTESYDMQRNVQLHDGQNTYIQHTEYHQATTTAVTTIASDGYNHNVAVETTQGQYVIDHGSQNLYVTEDGNTYIDNTGQMQIVYQAPETHNTYTSEQSINQEPIPTEVPATETHIVTTERSDVQTKAVLNETGCIVEQPVEELHKLPEKVPEEASENYETVVQTIEAEPQQEVHEVQETSTEVIEEEATTEVIAEEETTEVIAEEETTEVIEEEAATEVIEEASAEVPEESIESNLESMDRTEESVDNNLVIEENQTELVEEELELNKLTAEETVTVSSVVEEQDAQEAQLQAMETSPEKLVETTVEISQQSFDENAESETLVIHYEESYESNSQIDEQSNGSPEKSPTKTSSSSTPKPRGRKSRGEIPLHILGHNISNPIETLPNGKSPKPRLGVRVPCRNLTSQIVSKAEIQSEIVERGRKKEELTALSGEQRAFAYQLTSRLAKKIAGVDKSGSESTEKSSESVDDPPPQLDVSASQQSDKIQDNNDLLAILEGDGDDMPVLPKEVSQPTAYEANIKNLEREIALQQLSDLPYLEPTQITPKGKARKAPPLTPQSTGFKKDSSSSDSIKSESPTKDTPVVSKVDVTKTSPVDIEPQVKVSKALKTYSRKRKLDESSNSPDVKKTVTEIPHIDTKAKIDLPPPAYVTKSSRVIKKKVIWDPDEAAPLAKTPRSAAKPESTPNKISKSSDTQKSVQPKTVHEKSPEKKAVTDKPSKEKPEKKPVSVEKKAVEKSSQKTVEKVAQKKEDTSPEKKLASPKHKPKKPMSEVDRLLSDEGAIKMLYELKKNDTNEPEPKKKKDVISVTRTFKELAKKANELKNDLQNNTSNESPKSLRKKEGPGVKEPNESSPVPVQKSPAVAVAAPVQRKISKDSARSSIQTPPASPGSFQTSENAYLIRRRSSSSISSSDDIGPEEDRPIRKKPVLADGENRLTKKKTTLEGRIKKAKKIATMPDKKLDVVKKELAETQTTYMGVKDLMIRKREMKDKKEPEMKFGHFETLDIKRNNKHFNIELHYDSKQPYFTVQVLDELTTVLKKFSTDKDCHVVSLTSCSNAFCLGLDYKSLVSGDEKKIRESAKELAHKQADFLKCLLHFPKVLVAGIHGDCSGLAVTMLPLFDMVVATDFATFSTKYASLGCIPEAGFLLSLPHINIGLAAELLYTTQKLKADDLKTKGLVSKLFWPEKYKDQFKALISNIAKGSRQSLEGAKRQLRNTAQVKSIETSINSLVGELIESWTSSECQKNFALMSYSNN